MKSISAAIVILAAAVMFAAGAHIRHDDTSVFVMMLGGGLGLVGLMVWLGSLKEK